VWVIAHRGGGDLFPENTLQAFQRAECLGVDMVECDVHVSRDGELMVIHDATLERTGGRPLKVNDLTSTELACINVGDGQGVPTLQQVLEAIDIPVVVEIKAMTAVTGLVRLLASRPDFTPRIIPVSFHHAAVRLLVDQIPGLQGSVLFVGVPIRVEQMALDAHVRLLSLHYEMVTQELVEAVHAAHLMLTVWTPNTRADIAKMVAMGVDAIASDRPDRVLEEARAT
jgi:glycerophosphoryl diester phosphodiesterase